MKIIAIAGNATSGKDTLCRILQDELPFTQRVAFADALKDEVDEFLKRSCGISAWTTDATEKAVIRSFLVFWGTDFRRGQDPAHWIKATQNNMRDANVTYIITDLRYHNEYDWIRSQHGKVIYLSRVDANGEIVQPANDYEKENNKFLKEVADIDFTWKTYDSSSQDEMNALVKKYIIEKL